MPQQAAIRFVLALALMLVAVSAHAQAAGRYLNAAFGNPPGFSQGDGLAQCAGAALPFVQCVTGIAGMTGFAGTFTVKRPGIEVLLTIICDDRIVWAGERFQGTSDISVSGFAINGPCYAAWQEGNASGSTVANGDFEYQVVFH